MLGSIVFFMLAAVSPAAFFFSKNSSPYSLTAILLLIVMLAVFGAVAALVLRSMFYLARRVRGPVTGKTPWWEDLVLILAGVVVFAFLSHFAWQGAVRGNFARAVLFGGLTLVVFLFVRRIGWKFVNIFLAVFTIFSLANLALAEMNGHKARGGDSSPEQIGKTTVPDYTGLLTREGELRFTPNIYVFFLESFHNREYLQSAYGFDAPEFFDYISEAGFVQSPGFFSSHSFTLSSAMALLNMRIVKRDDVVANQDVRRHVRVSLCNNPVFKYFHDSGYRVNVFDSSDYMFSFPSPDIDFASFRLDNKTDSPVILEALQLLDKLNNKLRYVRMKESQPVEVFLREYPARFDLSRPNLFFAHFGAIHSNLKRHPTAADVPAWKPRYRGHHARACGEIIQLVERIKEHDSSALIVLVGDHGAFMYPFASNPAEIAAAGMSEKEVALDYSSVFYAVKWPEEITPFPEPKDGMNTIRIFPYLISNLKSAPLPDAEYPPLNAYSKDGELMIKNGVLLDKWEEEE